MSYVVVMTIITLIIIIVDVLLASFIYRVMPQELYYGEDDYFDDTLAIKHMVGCRCPFTRETADEWKPTAKPNKKRAREFKNHTEFDYNFVATILTRPVGRTVGWSYICSGAIISQDVILTTTQCMENHRTNEVMVRINSSNRAEGGLLYDVVHAHKHESEIGLTLLSTNRPMETNPIVVKTDFQDYKKAPLYALGWNEGEYIEKEEYAAKDDLCPDRAKLTRDQCPYEVTANPVIHNDQLFGVLYCTGESEKYILPLNDANIQSWLKMHVSELSEFKAVKKCDDTIYCRTSLQVESRHERSKKPEDVAYYNYDDDDFDEESTLKTEVPNPTNKPTVQETLSEESSSKDTSGNVDDEAEYEYGAEDENDWLRKSHKIIATKPKRRNKDGRNKKPKTTDIEITTQVHILKLVDASLEQPPEKSYNVDQSKLDALNGTEYNASAAIAPKKKRSSVTI